MDDIFGNSEMHTVKGGADLSAWGYTLRPSEPPVCL